MAPAGAILLSGCPKSPADFWGSLKIPVTFPPPWGEKVLAALAKSLAGQGFWGI